MALMLAPLTAQSADLAVLQNGFSIRHERRQMMGTITRLYLRSDDSGYVDVPTDQIEGFEKDLSPPPSLRAPADPRTVSAAISSASDRHRIDPDLISSMIRAESGFNPNAVSRKGAQGLMQLMPQTASRLGVADAFDPGANVDGGTRYLRELLERYDFDLVKALAAYNAGPGKVEQYRGIPPYRETRAYVSRIIRDFNRQKLAERKVAARGSRKAKSPRPVSTANQGSQIEPVPRGSR
jgi:soluble lytic murein transglycosylase-like protein